MDIRDKKIIIIGSGASGIGAAKLALSKGAKVSIYDEKQQGSEEIKALDVKLITGMDIDKQIKDYEIVVMSPGVPMDLSFVIRAREAGILVIGEFEFASLYCKAPTIAITGTNGKTTTTSLVGNIVKAYIPRTYVVGNIGRAFSEDVNEIRQEDAVIAEVSSFQLESIQSFHPSICSVLNITPDHLNRHGTMEDYIKAKKRIFENQQKDDFLILNYDDPECQLMKDESKGKVVWFSIDQKITPGVYLDGEDIIENIFGEPRFICKTEELKILGVHNIENTLGAVAITSVLGVPTHIIREQIMAFQGVAHRIEYVGTKKEIDFYNDSKATNPDAAIKGLLAMKKSVRLIAGGLDKGVDFTQWVQLFKGRVEGVYVIGETKEQLAKTMEGQGFNNYKAFDTLEEAIYEAYKEAQKGECILLSPGCASWDMFKNYEIRGELFKEIFQNLRE